MDCVGIPEFKCGGGARKSGVWPGGPDKLGETKLSLQIKSSKTILEMDGIETGRGKRKSPLGDFLARGL